MKPTVSQSLKSALYNPKLKKNLDSILCHINFLRIVTSYFQTNNFNLFPNQRSDFSSASFTSFSQLQFCTNFSFPIQYIRLLLMILIIFGDEYNWYTSTVYQFFPSSSQVTTFISVNNFRRLHEKNLSFTFDLTLCVPCIILQCVNDQRDAQFL